GRRRVLPAGGDVVPTPHHAQPAVRLLGPGRLPGRDLPRQEAGSREPAQLVRTAEGRVRGAGEDTPAAATPRPGGQGRAGGDVPPGQESDAVEEVRGRVAQPVGAVPVVPEVDRAGVCDLRGLSGTTRPNQSCT